MRAQRPALSGALHVVAHVLLVACGWLLFAGFWWLVMAQESHAVSNIIWLLASALVLLPIVTLYWVLHNRGIYARKGPRRQVQVFEKAYTHDWTGRAVHAMFDQLRQAPRIIIHSSQDEKHFQVPVSPPQLHAEAA